MNSIRITDWVLILVALIMLAGIGVILLKILKAKITIWKVLGIIILLPIVINLIIKLIK
jgi:hypothetical protein